MSTPHEFPKIDPQRLGQALLMLRVTLGFFLLLWGIEKFVIPERTVGIFGKYYGMTIEVSLAPLIGAAECLLAIAVLAGLWRTWSYGIATLIHAYSVISSWEALIDPWGLISGQVKHLFLAGVPVLAAFVVLFMLRAHDIFSFDYKRRWRRQITGADG